MGPARYSYKGLLGELLSNFSTRKANDFPENKSVKCRPKLNTLAYYRGKRYFKSLPKESREVASDITSLKQVFAGLFSNNETIGVSPAVAGAIEIVSTFPLSLIQN